MRFILLSIIQAYWYLIPPRKRRKCLFKKSCSRYVFDVTKEEGLLKGIKSLNYRLKHCRPGYFIINGKEGMLLISAHNEVFDNNEISERIFKDN